MPRCVQAEFFQCCTFRCRGWSVEHVGERGQGYAYVDLSSALLLRLLMLAMLHMPCVAQLSTAAMGSSLGCRVSWVTWWRASTIEPVPRARKLSPPSSHPLKRPPGPIVSNTVTFGRGSRTGDDRRKVSFRRRDSRHDCLRVTSLDL